MIALTYHLVLLSHWRQVEHAQYVSRCEALKLDATHWDEGSDEVRLSIGERQNEAWVYATVWRHREPTFPPSDWTQSHDPAVPGRYRYDRHFSPESEAVMDVMESCRRMVLAPLAPL